MSERRPLREELKQKLSRERLDDDEFARFERLLTKEKRWSEMTPFNFRVGGAVAALLLLGVTVLVYFPGNDSEDLPELLAQEVFTNHVHAHSLDLETHSIEVLRAGLDRLDFVPVDASASRDERLTLLGARYCTLQGAIAAQILFHTPSGARVTRYQAAYDPGRFGGLPDWDQQQAPVSVKLRGVEVRLWVEQGVVIAEAH